MSVQVEFDPREDFSSYRTWAFLPPGWEVPARERLVEPELDALVRDAIARVLSARGYAPAGEAVPDFLVTYHVELRKQLFHAIETPAMETLYTHHRDGGFEVMASRERLELYEIGTLVLDVAEGQARQLVWRGIGTRRVRTSFKRRAEAVVAEILESFPPGAESGFAPDRGSGFPPDPESGS